MYKLKAFLCFILSVCCVITFIPDVFADKPSSPMSKSNSFRGALDYIDSGSYYALPNSTAQPLETVVEADMKKCNIKYTTQLGQFGVMVEENVSADFDINVPREGYYNINLGYITTIGNNFETVISLKTNGQLPFAESNRFSVQKTYIDEGKITADSNGNQLRPRSIQVRKQQNFTLTDPNGYSDTALLFHFNAGQNKLTIESVKDSLFITNVKLFAAKNPVAYNQYHANCAKLNAVDSSGSRNEIQAETPSLKSSPMIYATSDKVSPLVELSSPQKLLLNTLGGPSWSQLGQRVTYSFDVASDGYYNIAIKAKQDINSGSASYRRIYIDDQVPFKELNAVAVKFSLHWQQVVLGGGTPYKFYLTKGKHTITLENVLGEYGNIVRQTDDVINILEDVYRRLVTYMGTSPDPYRDYRIDLNLPDVMDSFSEAVNRLKAIDGDMNKLAAAGGAGAIVNTVYYQLNNFIVHPETVQRRMSDFQSNIGTLAAFSQSLKQQPLTLDYIMVYSPDKTPKPAEGNFLQNAGFLLVNFFYSFFLDYNDIGVTSTNDKSITVWLVTGRDQAGVIHDLMMNDGFCKQNNVGVRLQLVQSSMVMPAVSASIAPDVILQMPYTEPVNYAMRGAVYDLKKFGDFNEVEKRFSSSSLAPMRYLDGVYGLPDTESFLMLFYRKDILKNLNLGIPNTWEDVKEDIAVLGRNNMYFGLPSSSAAYGTFLYQNGGSFYQSDNYLTDLKSQKALNAFEQFTGFFVNYNVPIAYDFITRFRMGEMPIAVGDLQLYASLQVTAPEINGLWGFTAIPGTKEANGTINRSTLSSGSASFIFSDTKDPEMAWKFLKWWTDDATQLEYSTQIEALLGVSARNLTANLNAFSKLNWTSQEKDIIAAQRADAIGVEQVPGGYYLFRNLDNAVRRVLYYNIDPRDTLNLYSKYIDDEVTFKCKEFGISTDRKK